ncbi:MAG: DASS family sodium-coupled anion symporter [Nitrospirae bacterium]|nr:DASS family sodium-coupled anion symporter [Nitrospirota bacterium]
MRALVELLFKRRWIVVGFLLGGLLLLLPPPAGLTAPGQKSLAIAAVAVLFFVTEPMPLPTVAILIGVFEVLLGIAGPMDVSRSFISDSLLFIMGSLMIAETIVKQKLDKRLALAIVRVTGPRIERVVVGLIAVSALIASFIGEHTVVAMMMPVGMTLVAAAAPEPRRLRNLSALVLLAIAYGAVAAGVGSPSGGARNAIVLAYWKQLFGLQVSYLHWMEYLYPMVLLQIPVAAFVLLKTFRPEVADLRRSIEQLKTRVAEEGTMTAQDWCTVGIFLTTVGLWITVSDRIGLGTTAMIGVSLYLMSGIARWEDFSRGINWGVILIYAGAISLGITMRDTGAANWTAQAVLGMVRPFGLQSGIPLLFFVALLTMAVASVMSSGATVGLLAPVTLHMADLSGTSVIAAGLVTAAASAFTFMTTIGSPACGMVYSSGYLERTDFVRAGWKMNLVSMGLVLLIAASYWRLLGLPR